MEFSRPLSDFPVLFKADGIFKDFTRQPCIFKYFSSLCEPCTIVTSVYGRPHRKTCLQGLRPSPVVIKHFSYSTQQSIKFLMLINVKMPTIIGILKFIIMLINVKVPTTVGILTFISMINTTFESLKARKIFIFQHFSFCEQLKFRTQLSWH